jgi:glycosyltransferase involved in cell wall biosynthesis
MLVAHFSGPEDGVMEQVSTVRTAEGHHSALEPTRRVTVVITGLEDFGIRTVLLTQFRHAAAGGLRFTYLAARDGDCAKALRDAGASVSIVGGEIPHGDLGRSALVLHLSQIYQAYLNLRRHLRRTPCEILYVHSYYSLAVCWLAARDLNCRLVCHIHNNLNTRRFAGVQRVLASLALAALADRLVAISDFVEASLWGPARRKACRIDNAIDVQSVIAAVEGVEKDPHRIVIVGRLQARKKQEIAIRAIKILRDRRVDCELEILGGRGSGPGCHHRILQDLIDALELTDRVHFAGVVSPPYRRVAAAAACVSCATHEPFGLVVLEAAACGTPVVAADAGATAELIEDGKSGLLFRPDDPGALADAVEGLLRDSALRASLAETARRRALERYDIANHLRALRRCFDTVLAQP